MDMRKALIVLAIALSMVLVGGSLLSARAECNLNPCGWSFPSLCSVNWNPCSWHFPSCGGGEAAQVRDTDRPVTVKPVTIKEEVRHPWPIFK